MTRKVERSEIVDYQTYEELRPEFRRRVMAAKDLRRIHVGDYLTFLFENHDTVLYQIQEMMRAEKIVKESAILHELRTYNELLGGPGELGCSVLIEIADESHRKRLLSEWLDLPRHLYVAFEDGERVYATYDPAQVGEDRLSAVQYVKFHTRGRVPAAVGTDFPPLAAETRLTEAQRRALADDLRD